MQHHASSFFLILLLAGNLVADELTKWDLEVDKWQKEVSVEEAPANRLQAYLFKAQEESAARDSGSLDPISEKIFALFFPQYPQRSVTSSDLTSQIMASLTSRYKQEQAHIHPVAIKSGKNLWQGTIPYKGIKVPTMLPWVLKRADQFRPSAPPSPEDLFWNNQLARVKQAMAESTPEQKKKILYWAGELGPQSGNWISIADAYMRDRNIPLSKQLAVRANLACTLLDGAIAVFDAKYTFLVRRPFMLDPQLKTYIPTPNHPSYPAGHSVIAKAAATLLSHYFPENRKEWERLAEESGLSRIWAGIHFPIDIEVGQALGKQVGEAHVARLVAEPNQTEK